MSMKMCSRCGEVKEVSEFGVGRASKDGLYPWCKTCYASYRRELRKNRPKGEPKPKVTRVSHGNLDGVELRRSYNLKHLYGITLDQYGELLERQGGGCATCGLPANGTTIFVVDHDHSCCAGTRSCGKCVRGILCGHCNTALGQVRDNKEVLAKMIDYLS